MNKFAKGLCSEDLGPEFSYRFWRKVERTDSCWLWKAATQTAGYGMIWCKSKNGPVLAHQAAYALECGEVKAGMEILHTCDNPGCVNPSHLKQGTHAENLKDAAQKGRMSSGKQHRDKVLAGLGGQWTSGPAHTKKVIAGLRKAGQVGESNPRSKLTEAEVFELRQKRAIEKTSYSELSRQFGISRSTARDIAIGKKRRFSPGPKEK